MYKIKNLFLLFVIIFALFLTRIRYNKIYISEYDNSSQGIKYEIRDFIINTFIPESEKFFDYTYKVKNRYMYSHDISSHLGELLIALVIVICLILTIKWFIDRIMIYLQYRKVKNMVIVIEDINL